MLFHHGALCSRKPQQQTHTPQCHAIRSTGTTEKKQFSFFFFFLTYLLLVRNIAKDRKTKKQQKQTETPRMYPGYVVLIHLRRGAMP